MNPQYIQLAVLVFAMVATRLWEEGRWRSGKMSNRTSALLVVGRLPILAGAFALITAREPVAVLAMTAIGVVVGAVLYPFVVGRLRRISGRR